MIAIGGGGAARGPAPRRLLRALAAALVVLLGFAAPAAGQGASGRGDHRPNVIVVDTDDQSMASFRSEYMPRTFRHFVHHGTEFNQSIVATPLCCPSRAALATGQYGHNNGVLRNQYSLLQRPRNVLPGWLKRSGYLTIHVGRFFNGWGFAGRNSQVAPGWSIWRTALEPHRYYDYRMRFNNRFRSYGSADRDYLTTNLNRIAAKLIRRKAGGPKPFYLQLDHFTPHDGPGARSPRCADTAVPAPADESAFADAALPEGPAFDESDLSDKPEFLRTLPPISAGQLDLLDRSWGCTLAALQEVDRGMGMIWRALRRARALRHTAVIFTSDNGYLFGEHRIVLDKHYPYEESIRVPLAIRLPRRSAPDGQPPESDAMVANIDLAPTILDLADAQPCKAGGCRTMDGRSLLGEAAGSATGRIPEGRGIAVEFDGDHPLKGRVCEYHGIRTVEALYVDHVIGRKLPREDCERQVDGIEHYRFSVDPYELDNLHPAPEGSLIAIAEQQLATRSAVLATCSGIEGRDPPRADASYCE